MEERFKKNLDNIKKYLTEKEEFIMYDEYKQIVELCDEYAKKYDNFCMEIVDDSDFFFGFCITNSNKVINGDGGNGRNDMWYISIDGDNIYETYEILNKKELEEVIKKYNLTIDFTDLINLLTKFNNKRKQLQEQQ